MSTVTTAKRVAFVVPASEHSVSGPRNSVTLLARSLNDYSEFTAEVFSPRTDTDFTFNEVAVKALNAKGNLTELCHFDIVVFSGVWLPENLRIARYLCKRSIPYVISPRSSLMRTQFNYSPYKKWPFLLLGGYRYLKKAAAIHFLSDDEKNGSFFNSRGVVISNALTEAVFEHTPEYGVTKVFGFLGRYVIDHKGLDFLIKSIYLVADDIRYHGWVVKFRGTDNRNELKTIMRMREEYQLEDILVVGSGAHGSEKIDFLNQVEVFVHTSRYEGQPQAVMEAMSCGCAILVSPGANMTSAVEHGKAGLNAPLDEQAIADALLELMENPSQVRDFRKSARQYAHTHFAPKAVARQYSKMLNTLLPNQS